MKVNPEQPQALASEAASSIVNRVTNERASTASSKASTVETASTTAANSVVPPVQRQTEVSLKRDNNGRLYYVVSDAKSGAEILEVPPKEVRDVDQGIQDYLKQAESKGNHVETKA